MSYLLRLVLLFPFGLIYGAGAALRRFWFERRGKRRTPPLHTIVLGNLTVGGTGKTPMAMLVADRIGNYRPVALLSRGYGRKSRGFLEVKHGSDAQTFGDEPLEMRNSQVHHPVFVCEDRLEGIQRIREEEPMVETVILDDAWQHLPLRAQRNVLLCDYSRPFYSDWPMPAGNLREFPAAASGADAIVVTKCPEDLSWEEAMRISAKLHRYSPGVYFATYENEMPVNASGRELAENADCLLISALASNAAFHRWASRSYRILRHRSYRDHHAFTESDVREWALFLKNNPDSVILTTRKDYMRMAALCAKLDDRIFVTSTRPKFLFDAEDDFIRILF